MNEKTPQPDHAPTELDPGEVGYWCPALGRAVRDCGRRCNAGHIHTIEEVPGKKAIVSGGPIGASCLRQDEKK